MIIGPPPCSQTKSWQPIPHSCRKACTLEELFDGRTQVLRAYILSVHARKII